MPIESDPTDFSETTESAGAGFSIINSYVSVGYINLPRHS